MVGDAARQPGGLGVTGGCWRGLCWQRGALRVDKERRVGQRGCCAAGVRSGTAGSTDAGLPNPLMLARLLAAPLSSAPKSSARFFLLPSTPLPAAVPCGAGADASESESWEDESLSSELDSSPDDESSSSWLVVSHSFWRSARICSLDRSPVTSACASSTLQSARSCSRCARRS